MGLQPTKLAPPPLVTQGSPENHQFFINYQKKKLTIQLDFRKPPKSKRPQYETGQLIKAKT